MGQAESKRKRLSTSLPIGEGQPRVRGRPASPIGLPILLQPSALDFRSKTLCSDASHSREAHVPSALLMAASSNMKIYYHVFLSFRGTDVRDSFLRDLYTALKDKGVYTFVDSEELRKGEEISPALVRAIEQSRIAIILFSKDYASSRWCLDELLKIMECKEKNGLKVFPVFYKVEPREVRRGRESYGRAMAEHESKFGEDSEKVKRWKKALLDAGSLSGWHFNDRDERDEAELIQSIVEELSSCLRPRSLDVTKYPVGIESRVKKLKSLSERAGSDVLMIGLWGPSGIGKTTIAKALYNAIEPQFQDCSFLEGVREKSKTGGLVALQNQLLSQISSHKELTVHGVSEGVSLIRERLCRKKVLLVLDDVDDMDQLNALAGKGDWFGEGSRIIVTSRDRHLLTSHDKNYVYEVKTLEDNEARDLFGQHAFTNSNKVEIRRDLIDGALHYAGGLPLALEVLGSFLRGRKEPQWESTLHKLSKIPEPKIDRVLKISLGELDENEREIFLDIACFFKGKSIKDIQEVLDRCDFDTTIGIEILIERSLVKNEWGYLQMHDLVQLMGRNFVKQECRDDPGKRSRLWLLEDVQAIMCYNTGTDKVQAIVLDQPLPEAIIISPDAFTNMQKLRMLILPGGHISSQAQVRLPNELRWLEWPNAPNLEFGSGPKKLVRLDVPKSHITQFGGNSQNFSKLTSINFSECKSLFSIHDMSSAPNMKKLILNGCESLEEVHPSVGDLVKLEVLSLGGCFNLENFPSTLKTKSLQTLELYRCSKLKKFPDIDGKMEHLEVLPLCGTAIEELPASIENLVSVKRIDLSYCKNLKRLPPHIYKLKNLECFYLEGCSDLITFPKNMEDSTDPDGRLGFRKLTRLGLQRCNLSEVEFLESFSSFPELEILELDYNEFPGLPTCINKYYRLKSLYFNGCKLLQEIPQLPPNIERLAANGCKSLQKLPDLWGQLSEVWLASCCELFRKGVNMDDVANVSLLEKLPKMKDDVDIVLYGREMPKWILPCEEDSISFMVPWDLYDKLKGLAFCVVLSLEEGKVVDNSCDYTILVNGQCVIEGMRSFYAMQSDHGWLQYQLLNLKEEHLRNDWSHFQVCLRAEKGSLKKRGFRLICEQKEDDLRVVFLAPSVDINKEQKEDDLRVVFPAPSVDINEVKFFWEDSEEDNSIDTEEEDTPIETNVEESEDSEEDNSIDTEEEDTPIEIDEEESS